MCSVVADSVIPCTAARQASGVDCDPVDCSRPDFPGKSTGMGCCSLLQGIFVIQGIDPRSPAFLADSSLSEPPGDALANTESAGTRGWLDGAGASRTTLAFPTWTNGQMLVFIF